MVRHVYVSTVEWSQRKMHYSNNVESALSLIDEAAARKPDVLCFPENFPVAAPDAIDVSMASPIPGPVTDALGRKAKEFGMYVICPITEIDSGSHYNTAALIDRSGEVVWKYRKLHPTIKELNAGVLPGTSTEVFETDFGKIGVMTCFDVYYPQIVQELARQGVEIVFFPSLFAAESYLRGIAWQYAVNVVSSIREPGSQIIDISGSPIAQGGYPQVPVISGTINLDMKRFEVDLELEKVPEIWKKYGRDVDIRILKPEDALIIESKSDKVTVDEIIKEFKMETLTQHLVRSETMLTNLLKRPTLQVV